MRTLRISAFFFLALLSGVPAVGAEDERDRLRDLETEIEADKAKEVELGRAAATLEAEAENLRKRLIAAAEKAQDHEQRLSEIDTTLMALSEEQATLGERLETRERQRVMAVMALQRLALRPPGALVALGAAPTDSVRSALILRAVVPKLRDQALVLDAELQRLAEVGEAVSAARSEQQARVAALAAERADIERMLHDRAERRREIAAAARETSARLAKLSAEARSIQDLIVRLERERTALPRPLALAAPPIRSFEAAQGQLTMPARGNVVEHYGDATGNGMVSRGLTIETRPGAQIVAPYDGQVAFSGPFRGYGRILIIEHSGGYHSLLAGMANIDAVVGQWVLAGEPVGTMDRSDSPHPRLYVEFRRGRQAINPTPWLAAQNSKDTR